MKGNKMKNIKKINKYFKKANEYMELFNRGIDLFQIVYKNILSIIGIYTLYNINPIVWIIAVICAVLVFIFETVRHFKE